jgi:kumamolisin
MLSMLLWAGAPALQAQAAETPRVTLKGNEAVAASHGQLLSHKADAERLTVTLSLKPHDPQGLDTFIRGLYDPASPGYKQYITPDQFAARFGATQADIAAVTGFAKAQGLDVSAITPVAVKVSGTAAQLERAFHVTINNYSSQMRPGSYYANAQAPTLPASVSAAVTAVVGLDNEPHYRHAAATRGAGPTTQKTGPAAQHPNVGSGPAGGYTPAELRSAYDIAPLLSAGTTGAGQTVALFELDGYVASNVAQYSSYYGLGSPAPQNVYVDGVTNNPGQGEVEVELDVEVVNAIAPGAATLVYEGPNTDQGVIDTYQQIATDNRAQAVSISWGMCEAQSNSATINAMHTIFSQMAAQGQSVFAASGDSGAYDCGTTSLGVDSPADDPYVTGVGGTHLTLSSGAYGAESVWATSTNRSGGGGGLSTLFSRPSWQTGPGTDNSYTNGMRMVPDVAADADPNTGYAIYTQGAWTVVGGTSAAAPLWAGLAALYNQYAVAAGKARLGQANPALYSMTQTYPAFHDITSGNNLYYPATTGYDLASGLGTPDAYNLIRDLTGSQGTPPPPPPPSNQLVTNGGFESGATGWTQSSSGGYQLVDGTLPHTGTKSAFLCGYNNCTDTIYQTVTIPATATKATLTFWVDVSTTETTHAYDYFYAELRTGSGSLIKRLTTLSDGTAAGWGQKTFDVTAYKGQTLRIYFRGTNDYSNPTDFFLDDVSLTWQ